MNWFHGNDISINLAHVVKVGSNGDGRLLVYLDTQEHAEFIETDEAELFISAIGRSNLFAAERVQK